MLNRQGFVYVMTLVADVGTISQPYERQEMFARTAFHTMIVVVLYQFISVVPFKIA